MTTYALTVSTNDLGLGVLSGARVVVERRRTQISDIFSGQALTKNTSATNTSGIAVMFLSPDDSSVYHEVKIFDLAGIPVYSVTFTMPPQAVALTDLPVGDIISESAAQAVAASVTATTQANIATTQAGEASSSATQAVAASVTATTQANIATTQAGEASSSATAAQNAQTATEALLGITSNIQLLNWAYAQAFAVISATRNANNVVTTASIVWPDGATGIFTADTINTTFNTIDAWHATYLGTVTKTVTQAAVTRNLSGAVIAQPVLTIS